MSEDLTTEEPDVEDVEDEEAEIEYVVEETTRSEYIACSYNAIQAVSELTTFTKEDERRKVRVIKKCLRIIENYVNEMYDEIFEEENEDD